MTKKILYEKSIISLGLATSIFLYFFEEGVYFTAIYYLGPTSVFIFTSILLILLSVFSYFICKNKFSNGILSKISTWLRKKEDNIPLWLKGIVEVQKIIGITLSCVVVGPVLTSILIYLLGYTTRKAIILLTIGTLISLLIITVLNAGIIYGIRRY